MNTKTNSQNSQSQQKPSLARRIIAWAAILLLVALYVVTLIAALFSSPEASRLFRFCLGMTVAVPIAAWILIYAIGWFSRRHTIASVDLLNSNPKARKEMEEALQREEAAQSAAHPVSDHPASGKK